MMSVARPDPGCGFPRRGFSVVFLIILLLLCFPFFCGGNIF